MNDTISMAMLIIAFLTVVVNILTEVAKTIINFKDARNLNLFVTIMSIVMTVGCMVAFSQKHGVPLEWYTVISFVVAGFCVAFAAMFGYDKLIAAFKNVKKG